MAIFLPVYYASLSRLIVVFFEIVPEKLFDWLVSTDI